MNAEDLIDKNAKYEKCLGDKTGLNPFNNPSWIKYINAHFFEYALKIDGDLIEFGCYEGDISFVNIQYTAFENHRSKTLYLIDTFEGLDKTVSSTQELKHYMRAQKDQNLFERVKTRFSDYANVIPVKGSVPSILKDLSLKKICYAHIDMNSVEPEVAALKYVWPLLSKGGVVIFDDYAQPGIHLNQKRAIDEQCQKFGVNVLSLPTGQGLLIKQLKLQTKHILTDYR